MRKRTLVGFFVSCALVVPGMSQAEFFHDWELSGLISNETGFFIKDGATIGDKNTVTEFNEHSAGDVWKFENRLRLFLNGGLGENSSLHAEANLVVDPKAVNDQLRGHLLYSQYDYFRELYIDSAFGEEDQFTTRLGKQQVVWGTADGIKLLDIINPTDFRFLNQSPFEDSRIPVWMAVGEYNPTDSINLQGIVAQSRPNFIPGLRSPENDKGQPFLMKGVDTITGSVDGFLNISPALGSTAAAFQGFAAGFGAPTLGAVGGATFTVQDFVNGSSPFCPGGTPPDPSLGSNCAEMLNTVAQAPGLGGNENKTNLVTTEFNSSDPKFTFEYMNLASFATFDTFARSKSTFRTDLEKDEPNLGFRFKQSTNSGINYSLNYYYHYNPNPSVEVFWEDQQGDKLTSTTSSITSPQTGEDVTTVSLLKPNGQAFVPTDNFAVNDGVATLVFREFQTRIHSVGGSFDSALDVVPIPTVLRGELLYQKDVNVPVIDRNDLAIGDVTNALRNEEADFIKYVLGADFTVYTNLLISGQLIQFWNLDYIDENKDLNGNGCTTANCGRYTGDPSTLSLSNGLRQGDELETFGSLFLSKPFGAEQQHRINNIFIVENGGGYWNRLDVEYEFTQISENFLGTAALNLYFGDENTLFGQFKNSSNFLVGLKYLFDPNPL